MKNASYCVSYGKEGRLQQNEQKNSFCYSPCISHYEDGFLVFQFVTRKAAPIKAVQALSKAFRDDDFRILWADEDCFNVGDVHFFNGCETDWYYPDGKDAEALYYFIWDDLRKETMCL